jgi:hypothetical protein
VREPNFSESQLQQAVNTAIIRQIFEQFGVWSLAQVPSLTAEFDLGWDTAFSLPWLPMANLPHDDDEGANLFIQYKLAFELTSPGANEWKSWASSYFRFKIPHSTRDASGAFVDDYHQWDRLKALADKSYPTFYAVNHTLSKTELRRALQAGDLLSCTPSLDVRKVGNAHKFVTFTATSSIFVLHSEKEEAQKLSLAKLLDSRADTRPTTLRASTESLRVALQAVGEQAKEIDDDWKQDLARIDASILNARSRETPAWLQHLALASFVQRHVGAELLWVPKPR